MQKTPADKFTVTTKIRFIPNPQLKEKGESCGFVLMGQDYATLRLVDKLDGVFLQYVECKGALKGGEEVILSEVLLNSEPLPVPYSNKYISTTVPSVAPLKYIATDVFIRMKVEPRERTADVPDLTATFWYSLDGKRWHQMKDVSKTGLDASFIGRAGKWIGAKFGFYCNRFAPKNDSGWMQVDWITVSK